MVVGAEHIDNDSPREFDNVHKDYGELVGAPFLFHRFREVFVKKLGSDAKHSEEDVDVKGQILGVGCGETWGAKTVSVGAVAVGIGVEMVSVGVAAVSVGVAAVVIVALPVWVVVMVVVVFMMIGGVIKIHRKYCV